MPVRTKTVRTKTVPPKVQTAPRPQATPKPAPVAQAAPRASAPVEAGPLPTATDLSSGVGGTAKILLLTLAGLFLVLAVAPWRAMFVYQLGPHQIARWRVGFAVLGFSVVAGWIIATYVNGVA